MSKEDLRKEIEFGLDNLERVYLTICYFSQQEFDERMKISALAYECLGYYNAIEHLMIRIFKHKKMKVPSGASSHKETLKTFEGLIVTENIQVDKEAIEIIETLMAFRHVATKIYGFLIDYTKLQAVIDDIKKVHGHIKHLFANILSTM